MLLVLLLAARSNRNLYAVQSSEAVKKTQWIRFMSD